MYKILNTRGLGVGGKQNELIELALTYGFDGVEIDMVDLLGREDAMGKEFACQFLNSADTDMGTFLLPVKLGATQDAYGASIAKIDTVLDLATTLGCKTCYIDIETNNADFSFQECFENHQNRLQELAERFAAQNMNIGLRLRGSLSQPPEGTFKFIQTAEELLALVKAVGHPNVGVCLDTWEWVLGGGTVAQLEEAGLTSCITEIRLADLPEDVDRDKIKPGNRTRLPGENPNSFSFQLMQKIAGSDAEIPVSAATEMSTFSGVNRDDVIEQISRNLDLLIEGKDPAVVRQEEAAAAAEAEAAEAGEGEEAEQQTAAVE